MAVRRSAMTAVAATGLAVVAVLGLSGAPAAAESRPAFAEQASRAGLTTAQARRLQATMDRYLAKYGGTQVAANKIKVPGADITVPVPGEARARDLDRTASAMGTMHGCREYYFCMYRGTDFTGVRWDLYHCRDYALSDWIGLGSEVNNQLPQNTLAVLYNKKHEWYLGNYSYFENNHIDWTPIWYVKPC